MLVALFMPSARGYYAAGCKRISSVVSAGKNVSNMQESFVFFFSLLHSLLLRMTFFVNW